MPAPIKVETLTASIQMVATHADGTKKMCWIEVDVQSVKTYLTSGGHLISLDGKLEKGMDWVSLGNPDSN